MATVAHAPVSDAAAAYAVLGVRSGCTLDEVKRAFRQKALATHPDRMHAGGVDGFITIRSAYEYIMNSAAVGEDAPHAQAAAATTPGDMDDAAPAGDASDGDGAPANPWRGSFEDMLSNAALGSVFRKTARQRNLRPLACSLGSFGLRPGSGCRQPLRTPFQGRGQGLELPSTYINARRGVRRGSAGLPPASAGAPVGEGGGTAAPGAPLPNGFPARPVRVGSAARRVPPARQRSASPLGPQQQQLPRPADSAAAFEWGQQQHHHASRPASTPPLPHGPRPTTAGFTPAPRSFAATAAHVQSTFAKKKRMPVQPPLAYASCF